MTQAQAHKPAHGGYPQNMMAEVIDSKGELWQIQNLIDKLGQIRIRFGNTCVLVDQLCWGALALNRYDDRKKAQT